MPLAVLEIYQPKIRKPHRHLTAQAVNNYDPTHTTTLRNLFAQNMNRRFARIRGLIRKAIVEEDCFALMRGSGGFATFGALDYKFDLFTPGRHAFDFPRSGDKVAAFMDWLKKQEQAGILEVTRMPQLGTAIEDAWTNLYIKDSYQRGVLRARYEMRGAGYDVPPIDQTGGIEVAMFQPPHVERLGLLYTRTFNDLKGITDTMDMQISRVLAQAMADGENPRRIARLLTRTISGPMGDLGITDTLGRFIPAQRRAMLLARTEVIRVHHQSMIQEYKNWGLEGVKVKAEWKTAGDGRVCDECASMEGKTYTLDEAMNLIPYHPQCRCIALPLDVTEGEEKETALSKIDKEEEKKITSEEQEFNEYKKELSRKYSSETMWKDMTDDEIDKYERLEREFYNKKKELEALKQTGKEIEEKLEYTSCSKQTTPIGSKLPKFDTMDDYIDFAYSDKLPKDVWLHGSFRDNLDLSKNFKHKMGEGYSSNYLFTSKNASVTESYANTKQGFFMVAEKKGINTFNTGDENAIKRIAHGLIKNNIISDDNYTPDKLVEIVTRDLSIRDVVDNSIYDSNDVVKYINKLGYDAIETDSEKIFINPWKTLKVLRRPELKIR